MKKQLIAAAVAATMTSVAMADISITGGAKVNYTNEDVTAGANTNTFKHDMDLTIAGTSGATTTSMTVSNAVASGTNAQAGLTVENVFVKSAIQGINVKMGQWSGSDSLLGDGSRSAGKFSADTTINGVKVQFEDQNDKDSSVTLSGSVAGVAVSHEIFQTSTDTSVSGSFGGVNAAYRSVNNDVDAKDKTSMEISTDVSGVTVTYATVDANNTGSTGTTSDAFFGTFATGSEIKDASGFGLTTAMAGNTVTLKSYEVDTVDYTKVVVNRPLAAGATFEATYTDTDAKSTLDLELAVKF